MNKAILVGNVGSDPEIRTGNSGSRVGKVSLATNHRWKDAAGTKHEKAEWHRLTFFGKTCDLVEQYVNKGDRIGIVGRIEYSQTENENGQTKYWTDIIVNEIEFLGNAGGRQSQPSDSRSQYAKEAKPESDDLPF